MKFEDIRDQGAYTFQQAYEGLIAFILKSTEVFDSIHRWKERRAQKKLGINGYILSDNFNGGCFPDDKKGRWGEEIEHLK